MPLFEVKKTLVKAEAVGTYRAYCSVRTRLNEVETASVKTLPSSILHNIQRA